ncbi:sigma-70 family RNA polymerase sigma factor [Phragmitibacter flavus]|uniref:Sigma-70 family RNA polymerase sigma factor n=1 Tax=Phragmitibacter flavus TaxID=2576071 RepID=A0A5R8KLM1_9BACT|nr:ECF-type sigma factor [Phragmitibacter flavus]TLD72639.1 sigma-70 family RNA polymerase sigma factor [Phragmitibacter flavus]
MRNTHQADNTDLTGINGSESFDSLEPGKSLPSNELMPILYEKLRRLAASKMSYEPGMQTLQPTALVHEAWLRLDRANTDWDSQAHFFGAAAEAMRRILVDRARARATAKRQLTEQVVTALSDPQTDQDYLLLIEEALKQLEVEDPDAAEIVTLKFFSGCTSAEIASVMKQSVRTIERQWTFAKAKLFQIIRDDLGHHQTDPWKVR